MHSKKIIGSFAVTAIAAAALTACGGGGGSAGTSHARYSVKVTAVTPALPTNYANVPALGSVMNNPYYSIIRVEVMEGSNPAPATTLNCSVDDYDVGALFDPGAEEDLVKDDDGNVIGRKLWRNRTFESSAGVATFGLLAGDKSGLVRVTCAAQDPRDGMETSGSAIIQVGYDTKLPAQISFVSTAGVGDGLSFGINEPLPTGNVMPIQIRVVDAALQPVPDPTQENLFIELLQTGSPAEQGARLGPRPWGTTVWASTYNGVAQDWVTAGPNEGMLCMRVTTDRFDNNAENGFTDPLAVTQCVEVSNRNVLGLTAPTGAYINCTQGGTVKVPVGGGAAPYTYEIVDAGGLSGVTIDGDGTLTVPAQSTCTDGERTVGVRVTDATGMATTVEVAVTTGSRESAVGVRALGGSDGDTFNFSVGGLLSVEGYGGKAPYTYLLTNANVGGLSVDANSGLITIPAGTCVQRTVSQTTTDADGKQTTVQVPAGMEAVGGLAPTGDNPYRLFIRATDSEGNTGGEWITFNVVNDCCSGARGRTCNSTATSTGSGAQLSPQ